MQRVLVSGLTAALLLATGASNAAVVDDLLAKYQTQGAKEFSAKRGEEMWFEKHPDPDEPGKTRNCSSCHTDDLKAKGKHLETGKAIDPLAPSVNSERLTDPKFIEKWLKRNCKWVVGRECSPQEKGDFLVYLRDK